MRKLSVERGENHEKFLWGKYGKREGTEGQVKASKKG